MTIAYGDRTIDVLSGESALDALLRASVEVPYSCRKGTCLTCLTRVVEGAIPPEAQAGLKPTLVAQSYALPCRLIPTGPMTLAPAKDAELYGRAIIERVETLAPSIARVLLRPATELYYHAGQFVNVRRGDGLVRSYSLASVPRQDSLLELHVRRMAGGAMSPWLCDPARAGEAVDIQGPNGACFYLPGRPRQPMLLIGTGTGLAPLIGIVRDALADGHVGPIALYHGSRHASGLYLGDALRALTARHANLSYVPCLSGAEATGGRRGRADEAALADHGDLKGYRVFVCGVPAMVAGVRRRAYLAGVSLADINGDAFDLRELRARPRD